MKNKKGFTLVEVLAVIAILGILAVITTGNILKHIQKSKIGVMITNENEVLDITNVYLEDYCKHPLNSSYKCPSSYKYKSQKYICLKTLKNTSIGEKLVDDITFDDDNCNGIIIFDDDKPGKTYLFCGKKGNYSYVTDENINFDDFECSYEEETNYRSEFIITYNSNTKSNAKFQRECLFGQPCSLSTNTFTNEGNHFIGWEDTNGVIYKEGESVQNKIKRDTNLYAKWEINTAIITYNANGTTHTGTNTNYSIDTNGKILNNKKTLTTTVPYGATLSKDGLISPNDNSNLYLSKKGYHFDDARAWCKNPNGIGDCYSVKLNTYVATDFCNIDNGNCTIELYANLLPDALFNYTGKYVLSASDVDGVNNGTVTPLEGNYTGKSIDYVYFLTDGILTFNENINVDVHAVGGGGGGGGANYDYHAGGGGGGYTKTIKNVSIISGNKYYITIGAGGNGGTANNSGGTGGTSRFCEISGCVDSNAILFAKGGQGGVTNFTNNSNRGKGGDGGSAGGGSGYSWYDSCYGCTYNTYRYDGANGASDGADSISVSGYKNKGTGQGFTTRDFGSSSGILRAGGGGGRGGAYVNGAASNPGKGGAGGGGNGAKDVSGSKATSGINYYGGGGGGGGGKDTARQKGGTGGTGIVIIRSAR